MGPNGQNIRRGKTRWLWVFALAITICLAVVTRWLTKPLPLPVVSLSLVGFKVYPTNTYAVIAMTNLGATKAYFRGNEWRAEFETAEGMVTNSSYFRRSLPFPRKQGEGHAFSLGFPNGVIRWRVVAWYEWLDRHNARIETVEWLDDHLDDGPTQRTLETVLAPVLGYRPENFDLYDFVDTPWLTNLPPTAVSAE